MTCIMSQGTAEQVDQWLPPATQFLHIGTYAQTELGHGTCVPQSSQPPCCCNILKATANVL